MKSIKRLLSFGFDLLHINTFGGFAAYFCVVNTAPFQEDRAILILKIYCEEMSRRSRDRVTSLKLFGWTIFKKVVSED
jgi:hypothetical protein